MTTTAKELLQAQSYDRPRNPDRGVGEEEEEE